MYPEISDRMKTMNPSAVREIFKSLGDPTVISFAGGNPSESTFPVRELSEISASLYDGGAASFLQYGITEGHPKLRELTFERMRTKYAVGSDSDDIMIVSGGQQAIDLALKCLTNEGDAVVCEDPSFIGALNDIRSYNTRLIGVPVDDGGMDTDALERILEIEKNVKLIYTIPTFHNPTGVTMTAERRKKLYELAVRHNIMILEDSPYFEIRYSGEDIPCIKSMDKTGHVIFCGSFSKTVAPGLRTGFLIADQRIMPKLVVAKQCADVHTPLYNQMLIAEYLDRYDMDAHIRDCVRIYTAQRDRMLDGLDKHLDKRVKFTRPNGGLFIWCSLPEGYSGHELCMMASERRVVCVPGSAFDPAEWRDKPGIRLNFSMPSLQQIDTGTKILGECVKEFLGA